MSKKNKCLIAILIISQCFAACISNTKRSNVDTTIVDFKYKKGEPLNLKDWYCYTIDDEKICIPIAWKLKKQSRYFFLSSLNQIDSNTYFVVLKYNILTSGLTSDKYLKETYQQLNKDSAEKFTGYNVKRIVFNDKQSIYGEYFTSINQKPYITYSTIFEKDNNLFEIALKIDSVKTMKFKEVYRDILFNFSHKNKQIFSAKDQIQNIQVIDLSKL